MRYRLVAVRPASAPSSDRPFYPETPACIWWGESNILPQAMAVSAVMKSIEDWVSSQKSNRAPKSDLGKTILKILSDPSEFQAVFTKYWGCLSQQGTRPLDAIKHAIDPLAQDASVEWKNVPASQLMTELSRMGRLLIARFELESNAKLIRSSPKTRDVNGKKESPNDRLWRIADIQVNHIRIASMSIGAVSPWAHSDAAIGAFLAGSIMESGEGGMDPARHGTMANTPAVQRASGVFGNDLMYFLNADEVVLKLAQSAKPGEGGHLPKAKLTVEIQRLRRADQPTDLVSPQPIHDLYSIEDLYLMIHLLKSLKPGLNITVKLASETDIAITALGAVKAGASQLIVSGERGGTGAAKTSSIFGTGMPLEYALKAVHDLLSEQGLRDQVEVVASGGVRTGRDIVLAHALGADRCEIGTAALISLGCRMLRKCHGSREISISDLSRALESEHGPKAEQVAIAVYDELSKAGYIDFNTGMILPEYKAFEDARTPDDDILSQAMPHNRATRQAVQTKLNNAAGGCTVGVNTQDLSYKTAHGEIPGYTGTSRDLQHFILFLSMNTLQFLAALGVPDLQTIRGKAKLYFHAESQEIEGLHRIFPSLKPSAPSQEIRGLLPIPARQDAEFLPELAESVRQNCTEFIRTGIVVDQNDMSFGAALAGYCGLNKIEMPVRLELAPYFPAPQSIGFCIPPNMTIVVHGSGNDHVGKSASGGTLVFRRPDSNTPISVGNQLGFGATYLLNADGTTGKRSQFWIDGDVGTRAFIRNSGAEAVIAGNTGDHCCEFMSNGTVVILGKVGRNFASGMTGGMAIVSIEKNPELHNTHRLLPLNSAQKETLKTMLALALTATDSVSIKALLSDFEAQADNFRVFDPMDVTVLLTQNRVSPEAVLLLKGEKQLGSSTIGSDKPLRVAFRGVAGEGFGQYIGDKATFELEGSAGRLAGHLAHGHIHVRGNVGSHGFWKAAGSVVVTGEIGDDAFCEFSGVGVVGSVGRRAFAGMTGTVVVMTDQIKSLASHPSGMVWTPKTTGLTTTPLSETTKIPPKLIAALNAFAALSGDGAVWDEARVRAELGIVTISDLPVESVPVGPSEQSRAQLASQQIRAGWTSDVLDLIRNISDDEPTTSMGDGRKVGDPRIIIGYGPFRLPFAQLTRPPIDAASESILMNMRVTLPLGNKTASFSGPILDKNQFDTLAAGAVYPVTVPPGDLPTGDSHLTAQASHHRLTTWAKEVATRYSRSKPKKGVLVHHYAEENSRHLPAWIPLGYLRKAFEELKLTPQLILSTDDAIEPHSADVLLNLLGVSVIYPRLVERTLLETSSSLAVAPHMVLSPEARVAQYIAGMTKAIKRIMAKNGDTDITTHTGSKTVEAYLLDPEMARMLGTRSVMAQSHFGLSFFVDMAEANHNNAASDHPALDLVGLYQFVLGGIQFSWDSTTVLPLLAALKSTPHTQEIGDIEDMGGSGSAYPTYSSFEKTYAQVCDSQQISLGSHLTPISEGAVVVIIGDGIAAMKSALKAAESEKVRRVVIIGKMPLPGGRLRYAVAPDHPQTKKLADDSLEALLDHPKVKLYTGITASGALAKDLHDMGCMVIVAPGSSTRKLTTAPWGQRAVTSSKMVAWYNSKPNKKGPVHRACPVSLAHPTMMIYGQGNAALDVARILGRSTANSEFKSQLRPEVLAELSAKKLETIVVLGRQPQYKTRFSATELAQFRALSDSGEFTIESQSSLEADIAAINDELVKLGCKRSVSVDDIRNPTQLEAVLEAMRPGPDPVDTNKFSEWVNLLQTLVFFDQYAVRAGSQPPPTAGKPVIRFEFGATILNIDACPDNAHAVRVSTREGRDIVCGGLISCIGFEQGKEVNGIRVNEDGAVFANGVQLHGAIAAGQAVTGRGTVGESTENLDGAIQEHLDSRKWKSPNGDQWIRDRYPAAFTKAEVAMIHRAIPPDFRVSMAGLMAWQGAYRHANVVSGHRRSYIPATGGQKTAAPLVSYTIALGTLSGDGFLRTGTRPVENVLPGGSVKKAVNAVLGAGAIGGGCGSGSCKMCGFLYMDPKGLVKFGLACTTRNQDVRTVFVPNRPILPHKIPEVSQGAAGLVFLSHDPEGARSEGADRASCGVGVYSYGVASSGNTQKILEHLALDRSRGAGIGAQGDGAGVVLSLDHDFFRRAVWAEQQISLPAQFGVIQIFAEESGLETIRVGIEDGGLEVLATRKVPMDTSKFHDPERRHLGVYQIMVAKTELTKDQLKERSINAGSWLPSRYDLCSASMEWITYKLAAYSDELIVFDDLLPENGYSTKFGLSHARFSTTTLPHPGRAHPHLGLIHNGEIQTKAAIIKWLISQSPKLEACAISMRVDGEELENGSDSAVLQIYISALELLYPEYTLQERLTLIFRPYNGSPEIVKRGEDDGLPLVSGPCNMAMIGDDGEIVFVRAENGFRPATFVQSDSEISITSARYCATREPIKQVDEGAIVSIQDGKRT